MLMLQGKVHAALRLLEKQANIGVAEVNNETTHSLRTLHPDAKDENADLMMQGEKSYFDPV